MHLYVQISSDKRIRATVPYEFIWATNGEALSLNGLLAPSRYDPLVGRRRAAAQQLNSRWQMGEGSRAAQAAAAAGLGNRRATAPLTIFIFQISPTMKRLLLLFLSRVSPADMASL